MDTLSIKRLLKDPDAIILYALAAVLVVIPPDWFAQAIDRLEHPVVVGMILAASGGRFAVRTGAAVARGNALAAETRTATLQRLIGDVDDAPDPRAVAIAVAPAEPREDGAPFEGGAYGGEWLGFCILLAALVILTVWIVAGAFS